jgi:hypothetical protein
MKKVTTLMLLLFTVILMAQDKIYVHTATAENSEINLTYLDHPDLNGNPNAGIVFSHVINPNDEPSFLNNEITGLWFDGVEDKWSIYNEDTSEMLNGSKFNVYITDEANVIEHIATPGNVGSFGNQTTLIDDALLNGQNPGPIAIVSNYWNPNFLYNTHRSGFYYDTGDNKRGMYNYDGTSFNVGTGFKVMVSTNNAIAKFNHLSTPANSNENFTIIDHPNLNGNPNASFVFTHYWGTNGPQSEEEYDGNLAAFYTGAFWAIAAEDGFTAIPTGVSFDIVIASQEILGVNDNKLSTSLSLYPNPANDYFTVSTTLNITKVSIYNMLGQQIKLVDGNEANSIQINVSELAQGNYFAKVEAEGSVETLKFIKNK